MWLTNKEKYKLQIENLSHVIKIFENEREEKNLKYLRSSTA